ncbi:MAG: hypothetical protein H8E44_24465 [Planctomycetes bacterium]|nr:hypothetical protein [Planctomycetota bacterium]
MPTITSQKPNRAAQLTLRPFTLLCTLVLLTFGVAHAQEVSPEGEDPGRVSKRPAKGEGQQGAVARILAGVDEGKISKERAAEMVKALNKNINQEDHANLKKMLEEYWKADPSIRGLLSTRIEGYLQHLQMGRSPAREAASQGRGERRGRGERPVSPAVIARLHREVGSYDSTSRIDMEAVGQDGGVINLRGTADAQVILNGQFLLNRSLLGGNESVTIIGADPGDAEYFSLSMDGNRTTFGYTIGGMERGEARVMKDPFSDRTVRTTFDNAGGSTTSVLVGPQQAEFMTVTHTRARRQPTDVLETILSSPVKPAGVKRSGNSPDPGANFSPEHFVLQGFAGDFEAEGKEGKVRSRMICQGRFLVSEGAAEDNDTVTFTGFDSARRVFQHVIMDPEMPGFRYLEGTRQEDGAIVFAARDGRDDLTLTLSRHDDGGYTLDDGKRSMRFRSNVDKASRGVAGEGAGQRRGDTTKSPQRPKQGGGEKGAVARILAGVDEGKISKEKATAMVKALNKNVDQEDPTLKFLLNQYWKADPSVRGALSTRIEGYLQHKAARQNRENKDADQIQNRDNGSTAEQAKAAAQYNVEPANKGLLKIVTDVAKGKTSIEKAADAIATMYKEFGVKKDDSTVKKQLEMATEFNESERMHKWFTLCIEVYIKKTFIEPANQESEAQEKEK